MDANHWTQGRYDLVAVLDAPDEETVTAILLRGGGTRTARTETLRASFADDMGRFLGKFDWVFTARCDDCVHGGADQTGDRHDAVPRVAVQPAVGSARVPRR